MASVGHGREVPAAAQERTSTEVTRETSSYRRLDQVQLKLAHLVGGCRIGRAFESGGKPLATGNVATLRVRVELARSHVFDHTLTQRTDGVSLAHGELLPD